MYIHSINDNNTGTTYTQMEVHSHIMEIYSYFHSETLHFPQFKVKVEIEILHQLISQRQQLHI